MVFTWVFDVWGFGSISSHAFWKITKEAFHDTNPTPRFIFFCMLYISTASKMIIYMDKIQPTNHDLDQARGGKIFLNASTIAW